MSPALRAHHVTSGDAKIQGNKSQGAHHRAPKVQTNVVAAREGSLGLRIWAGTRLRTNTPRNSPARPPRQASRPVTQHGVAPHGRHRSGKDRRAATPGETTGRGRSSKGAPSDSSTNRCQAGGLAPWHGQLLCGQSQSAPANAARDGSGLHRLAPDHLAIRPLARGQIPRQYRGLTARLSFTPNHVDGRSEPPRFAPPEAH